MKDGRVTGYASHIEGEPNATATSFLVKLACDRRDDAGPPVDLRRRIARLEEKIGLTRILLRSVDEETADAKERAFHAECCRIDDRNARAAKEHQETQERYASIRAEIEAWTPTTERLVALRTLALEQIDLSYAPTEKAPELAFPKSPEAFYQERVDFIQADIEEITKEVERLQAQIAETEEFLAELRESWMRR